MTRDSKVLWLGVGLAVVGYLQTVSDPPTAWSYTEWLNCAAFVLVWVSGKLATSPLKGAKS